MRGCPSSLVLFALLFVSDRGDAQCSDRTVSVAPVNAYGMEHVGGDCKMEGHNPSIQIYVTAKQNGTKIMIDGYIDIREDRSDFTEFRHTIHQEAYVPELESPHCRIASLDYTEGRLSANGGKDNHEWTRYEGSGIIDYAKVLSDTKNKDDCGKVGAEVYFHPITIRLEKVSG